MKALIVYAAVAAGNASVGAFTISARRTTRKINFNTPRLHQQKDDENEDERAGMQDAFASLDDLSALDIGTAAKSSESKIKVDLGSVDLDQILKDKEKDGPMSQDEINLYKDMYQEVEEDGGESVYGDILGDLSGSPSNAENKKVQKVDTSGKGFGTPKTSSPAKPLDDADGIGALSKDDKDQLTAVELSGDTDEFMRRALEEALDDAKDQTETLAGKANIIDESILQDEEFMREINAVFERANEKLLEGVSEIREEQAALSAASASDRDQTLQSDEARLKEAEGSVSRLVEKVRAETLEVEKAVADLKTAQDSLGEDPLFQAAGLKKAGIVRQSAVVGTILFSFRSAGELLLMAQGTNVEGHGVSAAIQALIALACGAYLLFF
jgi:hypothetical protein